MKKSNKLPKWKISFTNLKNGFKQFCMFRSEHENVEKKFTELHGNHTIK